MEDFPMPFSRYRERSSLTDRSFYGDAKGKKRLAGTVSGIRRDFENFKQQSQQNVIFTGVPPDSLAIERTWDETHPGPPYKTGGPFANLKVSVPSAQLRGISWHDKSAPWRGAGSWSEFSGLFYPTTAFLDLHFPHDPLISVGAIAPFNMSLFPDATGFGAQAWDRTRPQIAKAGMNVFLAELRDLPQMLKTTARGFHDLWSAVKGHFDAGPLMLPKEAADHFLNHSFGWAPFIGDLMKFYDTYEKSHKHIMQLVKDNGQYIKRRRTLEEHTERVKLSPRLYSPGLNPWGSQLEWLSKLITVDGVSCYGFTDAYDVVSTTVWAEGSFRYYRPEFDASSIGFPTGWSNTKRLLDIYGVRINPSFLWKITPWTWLIDWFFGIGRNIDIITENFQDEVAAKYLYVMHHKRRTIETLCHLSTYEGMRQYKWDFTLETKQRVPASSPYGFSLPWGGLSARQIAILGALGISRTNFG
jgi:hypothetical protein